MSQRNNYDNDSESDYYSDSADGSDYYYKNPRQAPAQPKNDASSSDSSSSKKQQQQQRQGGGQEAAPARMITSQLGGPSKQSQMPWYRTKPWDDMSPEEREGAAALLKRDIALLDGEQKERRQARAKRDE